MDALASSANAFFTTLSHLESSFRRFRQVVRVTNLQEAITLTKRIIEFSIRAFPLNQGLYRIGYGLKLFFWDGLRNKIKLHLEKNKQPLKKVTLALQWFYGRIKNMQTQTSHYSMLTGLSHTGAGVCGAVAGACQLGLISISKLLDVASSATRGFLIFSDLLSLEYYVNLFFSASEISMVSSGDAGQIAKQLKISAVMGIVASFSYLFAAAIVLLGGPAGIALAVCCIAGSTSCLKTLYDFFFKSAEVYL